MQLLTKTSIDKINLMRPDAADMMRIGVGGADVYYLDSLGESLNKLKSVYTEQYNCPENILTQKDIFTDKISLILLEQGQTGIFNVQQMQTITRDDKQYAIVLPVKDIIFSYISLEKFNKGLTIIAEPDNITIKTTITQNEREFTLEKAYSASEECVIQGIYSEVRIWP